MEQIFSMENRASFIFMVGIDTKHKNITSKIISAGSKEKDTTQAGIQDGNQ
jgi:hypothetical protein